MYQKINDLNTENVEKNDTGQIQFSLSPSHGKSWICHEKRKIGFSLPLSPIKDIQQEYPPKEKSNFPQGKKQPPPSLRGA